MIDRLNYDGSLGDVVRMAAILDCSGLSIRACREKARLFQKLTTALESASDRAICGKPEAFFVPGRIEVMGKHTNYAGGHSLVAATEQGIVAIAVARNDKIIHILDVRNSEEVLLVLDSLAEVSSPAQRWSDYPQAVASRLTINFPEASRGMTLAFTSDLPLSAGLSSSSALITVLYLALETINALPDLPEYQQNISSRLDLAGYLRAIENGQPFGTLAGSHGVSTFDECEDHAAILASCPGALSQFAYRPLRWVSSVPMPIGYSFVIGTSGVKVEKTGDVCQPCHRASRMAHAIEDLWRKTGKPGENLAQALASSPDAVESLLRLIHTPPPGDFPVNDLLFRLEHFFIENEQLLPAAIQALSYGHLEQFGTLVDQSQQAAEVLLGNQVPETSYLAASARCRGAVAASAFGTGFGGSVWAMVDSALAQSFLASWSGDYRDQFPQRAAHATFFVTAAGPAAFRIG